jgi:phosphohistidine phosphatase SixA
MKNDVNKPMTIGKLLIHAVLFGLLSVAVLSAPTAMAENEHKHGHSHEPSVIYLVRHAEKQTGRDPDLSVEGIARAKELARVLQNESIDTVFVTQYKRTQQTAAVVAEQQNSKVEQYDAGDAKHLAEGITGHHSGERILVVGHSNTLDDIAAALGVNGLSDLEETMYDRLYVIQRIGDHVWMQTLRFGVETP